MSKVIVRVERHAGDHVEAHVEERPIYKSLGQDEAGTAIADCLAAIWCEMAMLVLATAVCEADDCPGAEAAEDEEREARKVLVEAASTYLEWCKKTPWPP